MPFVVDTHPLVWYMTNDPTLSLPARRVLERADDSAEIVHIPCIVFFELLYLVEKRKVSVDFDGFVSMFASSANYLVEPLCVPVVKKASEISREIVSDPWDRLIAGTSMHLDLPLITRDKALRRIGLKTVW